MASKAQIKANKKYNLKTYKRVEISIRKDTEGDVIKYLEGKESVTRYIIDLIKEDMKKATNK